MKALPYKYAAFLLLIFHFGWHFSTNGQPNKDINFYPPEWWQGLTNDTLEILIHGNDKVGEVNLSKNQGLELLKITDFNNDRYKSVLLRITPQFSAAYINIRIGRKQYNYPILQKNNWTGISISQKDVMYLITPDRFANGNPKNDIISGMQDKQFGNEHPFGRHGGDITGIEKHLGYLKDLGVSSLWISPLLENDQPHDSYHGYAITNHYKIDPRFGTNMEYANLIGSMHSKGMSIVKDMVYNHVGTEHFLFKDLPDSSFFNFHEGHKNGYLQTSYRATTVMDPHRSTSDYVKFQDGWFVRSMPDLNQRNPHVARFLIQNSIWLIETFKLDGFRIDTYIYPDQIFMARLAKSIKQEYPLFYIFGETWVHGQPVQSYFVENYKYAPNSYMDAVTDFQMQYAFNEALHQQQGWTEGVSKIYYTLAADYLYQDPGKLVIFLDNHDLARFAGAMNNDLSKIKTGLAWLLTMRGIPCIYYGTEIGMSETENHGLIRENFPGGWAADSSNAFNGDRSPYQDSIFSYLKKILQWRAQSEAINGKLMQFIPENGIYAYFRYSDKNVVMVISNTSEKEQTHSLERYQEIWPKGTVGTDIISGETISELSITLKPMSCRIIEMN